MKKTFQALLFASVLLVGCGGTSGSTVPDNQLTNSVTSEYLTETNQNLQGICTAITRYGLPADDQTHDYVRREVGQLETVATDQPDLRTDADRSATEILDDLATAYERCDPEMGKEIRDLAASVE